MSDDIGRTARAEALLTLLRECVRFSDWAAGQGIAPVEGEPASDPEDFIRDFLGRVDADGLEYFTELVMALLPTAADLAGLAEGTHVVVPRKVTTYSVGERLQGGPSIRLEFSTIDDLHAFDVAWRAARPGAKEPDHADD